MDTWKVAKWMSESVKTVFSAVTTGPSDAVKFGEKSESDKPYEDCNTKHEVQGFRTIADKAGKKSHALTDQITSAANLPMEHRVLIDEPAPLDPPFWGSIVDDVWCLDTSAAPAGAAWCDRVHQEWQTRGAEHMHVTL
jgi:hypothetical protein